MTTSLRTRLARALILSGLALAAGLGHAEDDKRGAQLREAARRAQQAAQQAQQELATVRTERDRLAAEDEGRKAQLATAQSQRSVALAKASALGAELARLGAERDRLQADLAAADTARQQLEKQLEASQTESANTAQTLAEQRRVTATVVTLLERSVKALAAAEEANRQLQALGLKAVEAYASATPEAVRARDEPFFGVAAVRIEAEAEELRRAMGALKLGR
jgi:chromosome segregation ATPase